MRKMAFDALWALYKISLFGWWAGSAAFHLYTVYFAWTVSGGFAAVVSFLFPLLSQVYWWYAIWDRYDFFWNAFSAGLLAMILTRLLTFALMAAAFAVAPKDDEA
jgi:hypothetical protein